MRNNLQNDVKIENAKNFASKFNLSGSYSSTASVGEISVKFSRLLQPNTKAMCGEESLIFLAPLVAPTYAKQRYKTWHNFVPVEDVWPNYSAFMTQQTISRNGQIFQPTLEPCCPKDVLSLFVLNGAKATVHIRRIENLNSATTQSDRTPEVSGIYSMVRSDTSAGIWRNVLEHAVHQIWSLRADGTPTIDVGKLVGCTPDNGVSSLVLESGNMNLQSFMYHESSVHEDNWYGYDLTSPVLMSSSDFNLYMFVGKEEVDDSADYMVCFAFRLSSWGMHLFKTLRGLGYGIDMDAIHEKRSIIPLLATYKSYWDVFGLNLWQNFESTYCGRLISALSMTNSVDVWSSTYQSGVIWTLFKSFILNELGAMWLTEKNDYVSAHLPQPVVSSFNESPLHGVIDVPVGTGVKPSPNNHIGGQEIDSTQPRQDMPWQDPAGDGHAYIQTLKHGALDEEILKRLYKRTNANTALGKKIIDLMRSQGLGTYMERTRVNYIGDTDVELQINSVISQADTFKDATTGKEGAMLGQRGGRGVGYKPNDKKLYYKTDCLGYWICLDCITCDSGYSQAEDMTLACVNQHEKYQPINENLGLQLDSKAIINGSRNEGFGGLVATDQPKRLKLSMSSQPYGFAPRLSQYKVGRSTLSGGFALRSLRNQFLGYNMDKVVLPDEFYDQKVTWSVIHAPNMVPYLHMLAMKTTDVPTAGNAYRYLGRYPWMGNLTRIFAYTGEEPPYSLWLADENFQALAKVWEYHYRNDDNYIILGEIWFKAWSPMVPIEETYGTVDSDKKELEYVERV